MLEVATKNGSQQGKVVAEKAAAPKERDEVVMSLQQVLASQTEETLKLREQLSDVKQEVQRIGPFNWGHICEPIRADFLTPSSSPFPLSLTVDRHHDSRNEWHQTHP